MEDALFWVIHGIFFRMYLKKFSMRRNSMKISYIEYTAPEAMHIFFTLSCFEEFYWKIFMNPSWKIGDFDLKCKIQSIFIIGQKLSKFWYTKFEFLKSWSPTSFYFTLILNFIKILRVRPVRLCFLRRYWLSEGFDNCS